MIIEKIKINNFKSHKNTEIEFKEGLTAIIGDNGSGKTSIFEAMVYALFGPNVVGGYDRIVTIGKRHVRVELTFRVRGNRVKVVREYENGRGGAYLYINNSLYARGVNEVNNKIKEILGVDQDIFLNSIYIKQGEIAKLINNLRNSERLKIIGKLLGIEDFETCYEKMKEVINEYNNRLREIEGELKSKILLENDLEKNKKILEEKYREKLKLKEKLEKLEEEFKVIDEKYREYLDRKEKFMNLTNKLELRKKELKILNEKLERLERDFEEFNKYENLLKENESSYYEYINIEKEINDLEKERNELEGKYKEYNSLLGKKEILERNIEKLKNEIKENLEDIKERLNYYENEINKLERIRSYIMELESLEKELNEIENQEIIRNKYKIYFDEYIKLSNELEELKNKQIEYYKLLEKKNSLIRQRNELIEEIEKLERKIGNIEELKRKLEKIEEVKKILEELNEKKNKLNEKLGELNNEIKRLKKMLDELKNVKGKCPLCKSEISEEKKAELIRINEMEIKSKKNEKECIEKELMDIDNKIKNLRNIIKEEPRVIEELKRHEILEKEIVRKKELIKELEKEINSIDLDKYIINNKPIDIIINEKKKRLEEIESFYNSYRLAEEFLKNKNKEELIKKINELRKEVGNRRLDDVEIEIKNLMKQRDIFKEKLSKYNQLLSLKEELKKICNNLKILKLDFDRYNEVINKLKIYREKERELREGYNKYSIAKDRIDKFKNVYGDKDKIIDEIEETKKRINEIVDKINYIKNRLDEINYSEEEFRKIENERNDKEEKLNSLKIRLVEIERDIDNLENNIKQIEERLNKLKEKEAEREKLLRFIDYLKRVRDIYSRGGFQRYLRKKFIPIIRNNLNKAFSEFELPYSFVDITDNFDIIVKSPNGDLTIENLSGGEQIALALSLRLAIANSLVGSLECLILDEPTIHLDENRVAKLIEIFRKIRNIPQMIVITHHKEIEEVADNIIRVYKEDYSKVSVE
ncbi:AAA family ATPase [Methanocaldococcus villosus]|uniref:AAA family ATPase n=1 Tax=Methanocaldococcus villosus TaxID=667126 RepID=UPI000381570E|nr:AAA family ATPase [Methanocaldococcus villosus]